MISYSTYFCLPYYCYLGLLGSFFFGGLLLENPGVSFFNPCVTCQDFLYFLIVKIKPWMAQKDCLSL